MYHEQMAAWFDREDELALLAFRLSKIPGLVGKLAKEALIAGEFQLALEYFLIEAAKKNLDIPNDLIAKVRDISEDLLPLPYQTRQLISA